MPGFEPGTTCTPARCATRLRYIPKGSITLSTTLLEHVQHSLELVPDLEQDRLQLVDLRTALALVRLHVRDLGLGQARHRLRRGAAARQLLLEALLGARGRAALRVEQLLDAQHGLDVLAAVDALSGAVLRRSERLELGLPVAQHVGLRIR